MINLISFILLQNADNKYTYMYNVKSNSERKKIYTYNKKNLKVKKFNKQMFQSVAFISYSASEQ